MLKTRALTQSGLILITGAVLAASATAQSLSGMAVEPATISAGGSIKATLNFDVKSGVNCGMRLHWGDGSADNFKINQRKDAPWIASHSYATAGSFEIMAEPKTQGFVPRCGGDNQRFTLVVGAAAAPVVAAAAQPKSGAVPKAVVTTPGAPASPCPAGWKLGASGINAKSKAFTCIAAPNTKLPEQRLGCPGDLGYFENAKKGQLGCRP